LQRVRCQFLVEQGQPVLRTLVRANLPF
jgi:hypothetical protein